MISLTSTIPSIVSLSLIGITPLPQLPITGLITNGYPTFSKFSDALSLENEKYVLGVGILFFFNNSVMNILFPQILATSNLFNTGMSKNSKADVK